MRGQPGEGLGQIFWKQVTSSSYLTALKVGHGAYRQALADLDTAEPLTLVLPDRTGVIRGHVLNADGIPTAGVTVCLTDRTPCAVQWVTTGEHAALWSLHVESEPSSTGSDSVLTDAEGAFEIDGLFDREYELAFIDQRTLERGPSLRVFAGTEGVELQFAGYKTSRVAGRMVSAAGVPLAGIVMTPQSSNLAGVVPHVTGLPVYCVTDENGRFEFERLAYVGAHFQLTGEAIGFRNMRFDHYSDLTGIELVLALDCDFQIERTSAIIDVDRVQVLDENNQVLTILRP